MEECYAHPPKQYIVDLIKAGGDGDIMWKLVKQLPDRRRAGQAWVDHMAAILVDKLGFVRNPKDPQFFRLNTIALELHMDDFHMTGDP